MPTAILVDGGFFIKRYRSLYGFDHTPKIVAETLHATLLKHLQDKNGVRRHELYRLFYYDCPPLRKKAHNPISGRAIDLAKSQEAKFRLALHEELKRLRKVALRLGYLAEKQADWVIKSDKVRALLKRELRLEDLTENDVVYDARQKGVDMRIGLDIASMAFKHQVDQIVLIAGDSDFVPAAKLARREGIDFILDPMWCPINPDLHEHIDGLKSVWPKPNKD
ncbi:MAG: NYN domain-containing protein [Gammaproteobacteria bacterium]